MASVKPPVLRPSRWSGLAAMAAAAVSIAAAQGAAASEKCTKAAEAACSPKPSDCRMAASVQLGKLNDRLKPLTEGAAASLPEVKAAKDALDAAATALKDKSKAALAHAAVCDAEPLLAAAEAKASATPPPASTTPATSAPVTPPVTPPPTPATPPTPDGVGVCKVTCTNDTPECRQSVADAATKKRADAIQKAKTVADELDRTPRDFEASATPARQQSDIVIGDANKMATNVHEAKSFEEMCKALTDGCEEVNGDLELMNREQTPEQLRAWSAQIEKLCQKSCTAPGAFCIEATTGDAFCRNSRGVTAYDLPASVGPGATLVLRVMGLDNTGGIVDISTSFLHLQDTLTAGAPPKDGQRELGKAEMPSFVRLKDDHPIQVPGDANLLSMTITFKWTPDKGKGDKDKGDKHLPALRQYDVDVDQGKYYIEVGLLTPVIVNGSRTVAATPIPGSGGEQRITVIEDSLVSPALALNVFPGGRRKGHVSAFFPGRFWDVVGVQAGVNIDLSHAFDRVYLGGVLEPIAGLSLNPGLALVKSQFVPDGYATKMIVPKGETFTPDTKYMPRFYLGITVTNEILTTITGAAQAIKGSAPH